MRCSILPACSSKSVALLERQEEFARSRLKLQSRYHHVLVDEFQDTSRLQWRLIELLMDAWGEGEGAADAPTSIFVVGDRKQSIYRFRHAEVTLLDEAARKIAALRPGRRSGRRSPPVSAPCRSCWRSSTRSRPGCDRDERQTLPGAVRVHATRIGSPVAGGFRAGRALRDGEPVLGLVASRRLAGCAAAVAAEVAAAHRHAHGPRPSRAAASRHARRHRDPVSRPRRPSVLRGRPRSARHPDLCLQGPRVLRRARSSGPSGAAARTRRSPSRTSGPPSSCGRASCGFPTSALVQLAPAFRRALRSAGTDGAVARSADEPTVRLLDAARARPRALAAAWRTACRRVSSSTPSSASPRMPSSCAAAG